MTALVCSFSLLSQGVAINNDGSNADGSAMLDVQSTESGILIPRMTQTERDVIVSPATGLMIYQTDNTPGFYYNSGDEVIPVWEKLVIADEVVVDGSGSATQVAFWDDINSLNSDADLYWDNTNKRLGIGTATPSSLLHLEGAGTGEGNVLFSGEYKSSSNQGDPPANGPGTRMMWYPDKAAFRVGYVDGTEWDKANIGNYSFASGYNTISGYSSFACGTNTRAMDYSFACGSNTVAGANSFACGYGTDAIDYAFASGFNTFASGRNSVAMGENSTASGENSYASGHSTIASGIGSFACGETTLAYGGYSFVSGYNTMAGRHAFATGYYSTASGTNSYASGRNINSLSYSEFALGTYNTLYTPVSVDAWNSADRLFVIGNGESLGNESDAMVILKNGNTGIGTSTPSTQLHTTGGVRFANYTDGTLQVDANGDLSVGTGSSLFAGGNGLSWSGTTLNSVWTQSGNDIYNNNTADIGIGTSSPSRKLEVSGSGDQYLRVSSTDHNIAGYEWYRTGTSYYDWRAYNNGGNLRFAFSTDDLTTVTDLVTFRNTGNVGIGTTAPSEKLEVIGNVQAIEYFADKATTTLAVSPFLATTLYGANIKLKNQWNCVLFEPTAAGTYSVIIPVSIPVDILGSSRKVKKLTINYKCDDGTGGYITHTYLRQISNGVWSEITNSGTNITSNSWASYSLTPGTSVSYSGSLYIVIVMTYTGTGTAYDIAIGDIYVEYE